MECCKLISDQEGDLSNGGVRDLVEGDSEETELRELGGVVPSRLWMLEDECMLDAVELFAGPMRMSGTMEDPGDSYIVTADCSAFAVGKGDEQLRVLLRFCGGIIER